MAGWTRAMNTALVLFTRDLRVHDQAALAAAVREAKHVVPLFVLRRASCSPVAARRPIGSPSCSTASPTSTARCASAAAG